MNAVTVPHGQPSWSASLELPPHSTSPRAARRLLELAAEQWDLPGDVYTVELLLTEVVTNAVVHAGTEMVVRFLAFGDHLRVEVSDCSGRRLEERHPNSRSENGRGLLLLDRLTREWGWREDPGETHCKTVWFETDTRTTAAAPGSPDAFDIDSVEPL